VSNILLSRLSPYADEIVGIIIVDFDETDQLLVTLFCILHMLEKKWEYNERVHQLFVKFKNAYDSVRWEVVYNILVEFGVPKKRVRLTKMCLNESYRKVVIDKYLSGSIAFKLCFTVCH
jgi:hypothetical protein